MSDKLRKGYALPARFTPGELPSAPKLTGISTQTGSATTMLEKAIGDLWNMGGDPVLAPSANITLNALHIANLGRFVGRASLLNMMVPGQGPLSGTMTYVDDVGARYGTLSVGYLRYRPASVPNVGNMILGGVVFPLVQGQFKTSPSLITVTGDWHVSTTGKIYSYNPLPLGITFSYAPTVTADVKADDSNSFAGWNVIPDPTTWTGNYTGLKISFANGTNATDGFHIWLPPRKPLAASKTLFMSPSVTNNTQSNPDGSATKLMFQDASVDASLTNGGHYRYNLPKEISGLAAGTLLPDGFLYIWDELKGTIVEGVSYLVPSNTAHATFKLRVTGADLVNVFGSTVGNGIITSDSTQLVTDYISRFKFITVGNSVSKNVLSLSRDFWNHSHKNSEGGKPVSHADLDHLVTPSLSTNYPSTHPPFGFSRWVNDDHTQYVHRGGSTESGGTTRDTDDNAVFNKLIVKRPGTIAQGHLFASNSDPSFFPGLSVGGITTTQNCYVAMSNKAQTAYISIEPSDIANALVLITAAGNGTVRIFNGQVDKLYFATAAVHDKSTEYLSYDSATKVLSYTSNNTPYDTFTGAGTGTIRAREFSGKIYNGEAAYVNGGLINSPSQSQDAGYRYRTPRIQNYTISPMDFNVSLNISNDDVLDAGGTIIPWNLGITSLGNNRLPPGTQMYLAPLHLPHGAKLDAIFAYVAANSEGSVVFGIKAHTKGGSAVPPIIDLGNGTGTATSKSLVQAFTNFDPNHIIDNTIETGNVYYFYVTLPPLGTSHALFFNGTVRYSVTIVDN